MPQGLWVNWGNQETRANKETKGERGHLDCKEILENPELLVHPDLQAHLDLRVETELMDRRDQVGNQEDLERTASQDNQAVMAKMANLEQLELTDDRAIPAPGDQPGQRANEEHRVQLEPPAILDHRAFKDRRERQDHRDLMAEMEHRESLGLEEIKDPQVLLVLQDKMVTMVPLALVEFPDGLV